LTGRHRALKRFFKQKDYKNSGYLSVGDFKDGFKFIDVQLSNEELYFLNIKLDPDMTGLIDYKGFIGEYMRSDEF
jgi:Ca2+-binding EF-hand superfamily protein